MNQKQHRAGSLVVLLAVALAGCGASTSSGGLTTTLPARRTTITQVSATATAPPTTVAPPAPTPSTAAPGTVAARPDLGHLVRAWGAHCCGLSIDDAGHFRFAGRVYVWCGDGPPPCDSIVGNDIHDGALADGVVIARTGDIATVRVTSSTDRSLVPQGTVSFVHDPIKDTLTIEPTGVLLCGRSAQPECFGA